MKNLKKLLLCGLVVFTLTGCMAKQQETVKIDKDKNVTFKISISMDDEMLNNILKIVNANPETDISDESKWEYLTSVADRYENWNKEKIDKDGYKGYVLTYNTKVHLDDLLMADEVNARYVFLSNPDISGSTLFKKDGDKYNSVMSVAPPDEYKSYIDGDISKYLDMKFSIILPNKPISSNADEISKDGKTLTWKITENKNIDLSFKVEKANIIVYIITILSFVALLSFIVVIPRIKKHNN